MIAIDTLFHYRGLVSRSTYTPLRKRQEASPQRVDWLRNSAAVSLSSVKVGSFVSIFCLQNFVQSWSVKRYCVPLLAKITIGEMPIL